MTEPCRTLADVHTAAPKPVKDTNEQINGVKQQTCALLSSKTTNGSIATYSNLQ